MEVSGITVEKALAIENASVVSGSVNSAGQLQLQTKGGAVVNAGSVAPTREHFSFSSIPAGGASVQWTLAESGTLKAFDLNQPNAVATVFGSITRPGLGVKIGASSAGVYQINVCGYMWGPQKTTHYLTRNASTVHVYINGQERFQLGSFGNLQQRGDGPTSGSAALPLNGSDLVEIYVRMSSDGETSDTGTVMGLLMTHFSLTRISL